MKNKHILSSFSLGAALVIAASNAFGNTSVVIDDPYKDDQADSPWTKSMENVTSVRGRLISGAQAVASGGNYQGFDSYSPFDRDRTEIMNGYGSTSVGVGCDGINLGGVIDGQMNQYGNMVEQFIQSAPALGIMYVAYSQPVLKAVIDEMNTVGQFGLDLSNLTCSGVRAIADKSAEEKAQAMAEARCTAEAGFKDPECMSDEGILGNMADLMRDTKQMTNERAGAFLGSVNTASGGLIRFSGGVDGENSIPTGVGGPNNNGNSNQQGAVTRSEACSNIPSDGLRSLILGASGIPCYDIENYGGLLPDYKISEDGVSGVVPRTITIRMLASEMVSKHQEWLTEVISSPEATYLETDGFKAIYNRTNISITVQQHRALNRISDANPAESLNMIRNLAQMIAMKDLTAIVNRMEIAVLTGIQNQPDQQLLPDFRRSQFVHAVETLKAELNVLSVEVDLDLKRKRLLEGA